MAGGIINHILTHNIFLPNIIFLSHGILKIKLKSMVLKGVNSERESKVDPREPSGIRKGNGLETGL